MKKILFLILCACLCAAAQNSRIKFDVDGRTQGISFSQFSTAPGLKGLYPSWIKEENLKKQYMIFNGEQNLPDNQWSKYEYSFTPAQSGVVALVLRSMNKTADSWAWTAYRNITVKGGTFTERDWRSGPGRFRNTEEGKIYYAAHDASTPRNLKVVAGQTVTVAFEAQAGPSRPAKKLPIEPDPLDLRA